LTKDARILDFIDDPSALHALSEEELVLLASEIREQIIATTSHTGGHVASSLGAVEIILAVHSLINSPKDKFIFDVGHQSYAHKLVTGRRDTFDTLRTYGGISGFPKPSESAHDVHPSGHASDSLSVASGYAKARVLNGTDEKIVALIGDASLGGGMAFEALNYIGSQQLPIVIILNDNEMSISKNVGALVKHLGNIRATSSYRNTREGMQAKLEGSGRAAQAFLEFGKRAKDSMKQMVIPQMMIYEELGIVCTPPVDGNDIHAMREILQVVINMQGPVLVHAVTKKGVGYAPAVADPERFHGVGPYDIATGKDASTAKAVSPSASINVEGGVTLAPRKYTDVFGETLCELATADERIVAITAAMEGGTGLKKFHASFPKRFIDVGIAEQQAVGMACGLAGAGKKPVVAVYSTFMQRAIDQMIVDVVLPKLNVVFALDRAGLVGDDGPTHNGIFDIVYCRMIPGLKVLTPSDECELASAVKTALSIGGPVAIRYPRGKGVGADLSKSEIIPVGISREVCEGSDVAILAFGRMVKYAYDAAQILQNNGVSARVVDMRWVSPLDANAIRRAAKCKLVVTLEEGVISGGAGEGVLDILSNMDLHPKTMVLGVPDVFTLHGDVERVFADLGIDASGIANQILQVL
jgi:1-deoxy-D-xylulose-5-phosphate synthase